MSATCYNACSVDRPRDFKVTARQFSSARFVYPQNWLVRIKKGLKMTNIFVGNLSFGATEQTVRALFEPHGAVERVSIVTDRDTGRSRGFGFVEMNDAGEAENAIAALNGRELDGRKLTVNEARPRAERGGFGAGRSSRGSGGGYGRKQSRW
jgi:cold-inducible RNA-binding protein